MLKLPFNTSENLVEKKSEGKKRFLGFRQRKDREPSSEGEELQDSKKKQMK